MIKTSNGRESYSKIKDTRHDMFKYTGFNYEGKQIKKSISSYLLTFTHINNFVEQLEHIVYFLTEKAKIIVKFNNFAMDSEHIKFR